MKLAYSLIASAVVTAGGYGLSGPLIEALPKGGVRDAARRYVLAPGETVVRALEDDKNLKKLRKKTSKKMKTGAKTLDKAADKVDDALDDYDIDVGSTRQRVKKLTKLYNVSVWAVVGFAVCSLLTLLLGVASAGTALKLGVQVTLAMIFLQGALVLGGVLVFQNLAG